MRVFSDAVRASTSSRNPGAAPGGNLERHQRRRFRLNVLRYTRQRRRHALAVLRLCFSARECLHRQHRPSGKRLIVLIRMKRQFREPAVITRPEPSDSVHAKRYGQAPQRIPAVAEHLTPTTLPRAA